MQANEITAWDLTPGVVFAAKGEGQHQWRVLAVRENRAKIHRVGKPMATSGWINRGKLMGMVSQIKTGENLEKSD